MISVFGYVVVNKSELKFREFEVYQSYYCGLCRELKRKYGVRGQVTLTYDMTFLLMVLSGLYEPREQKGTCRCVVHPGGKHPVRRNEITEYAADMNLLMAYYKCQDDWSDEKKVGRALLSVLLRKKSRRAAAIYRGKVNRMAGLLQKLYQKEKDGIVNLDEMAGCFGEIMAELFDYRQDVWSPHLRKIGFYLGKFIYLMDAYDDVEEDTRNGSYNPLKEFWGKPDFEEKGRQMLTMMMAECCREFEILPVIRNAEIIRNILYSGVWGRFEAISARRRNEQDGGKHAGSV